MIALAIDTSTDVRAGLVTDDGSQYSDGVADNRAHAEMLMPLLVRLAARAGVTLADVTDVFVGVGPGPFTGLRVGVVTGQILAGTVGATISGVCSLDVAARQYVMDGPAPSDFLAVSDARRKEVYWARYDSIGVRSGGPFVTSPDELPALPTTGPGAGLTGGVQTVLDAGLMAAIGHDLPDAGLVPLYLRRPDAEVSTRTKSTLVQPRLRLRGRAR